MSNNNKDIILVAENISKQYRLGVVGTGTLSHDLNRWWHRVRGKEDPFLKVGEVNDRSTSGSSDYAWALRDINFEVQRGEVLGIIGKNGAGKSTLLKILSRVTSPTTGEIKTKGRIASLLEVGTGFHPELTGRENIYLNGAILGMSKAEIKAKEEEIIEFSGCQRYVDTPVKRYSSGMRVRLAFAVAAHLEPDILVIDEVLAVGDAEFQKKAIGKMQDISKGEGRTVLFVSHNMAAVKSLCTRAIVLENGVSVFEGDTDAAVDFYLHNEKLLIKSKLLELTDRIGSGKVLFSKFEILNIENKILSAAMSGEYIKLRVHFHAHEVVQLKNCRISISVKKDERDYIVLSSELVLNYNLNLTNSEKVDFILEKFPLSKGLYKIELFLESEREIIDWIKNASDLHVENGDFYGIGKSYPKGWEGKTVLVENKIEVS
ncbi:ABC transporter ATP-binding protein [Subsaximicrobium wynnwilliamsii]|uniref:ABC transporter ATP-binding protein n=1 Tax=Subsaximicrobium wynnwilliamsii TaxID=291179 RepID=A0A5C6ZDB5_9FLAO|nr:ABC transporter ATP-binding protein [Subsaximicrobium wynnwilliamsii]TXD81702.1 ABC transporter ATP-binding protein [Subsaximicrobium wynnwilliamsii]TXD87457.1 ABC transporter ATP-binding protein [Subsaximicrobium wynnwilliamsii]TXE01145.1 ABC transporter ATP-binding protein [Subsaximicrobium wynnwilliamsii]